MSFEWLGQGRDPTLGAGKYEKNACQGEAAIAVPLYDPSSEAAKSFG